MVDHQRLYQCLSACLEVLSHLGHHFPHFSPHVLSVVFVLKLQDILVPAGEKYNLHLHCFQEPCNMQSRKTVSEYLCFPSYIALACLVVNQYKIWHTNCFQSSLQSYGCKNSHSHIHSDSHIYSHSHRHRHSHNISLTKPQ